MSGAYFARETKIKKCATTGLSADASLGKAKKNSDRCNSFVLMGRHTILEISKTHFSVFGLSGVWNSGWEGIGSAVALQLNPFLLSSEGGPLGYKMTKSDLACLKIFYVFWVSDNRCKRDEEKPGHG